MKVVILAAGEGKRMMPLTLKTPKPLLKVNGKPIIEYVLESFPPEIEEVIIAIRYRGEQIKKHIGKKNRHMKIRYVLGSHKGTAYSFLAAKKYLKNERFLVVYGDDLPHSVDIKNCLAKDLSILVYKPKNPSACGMAYLRKDGTIRRIIEKPKKPKSNLAVSGLMVLNTDIFDYTPSLAKGEFYFSLLADSFAHNHKVFPVNTKNFIGEINTPGDLIRAGNILKAREKTKGEGLGS